jgi:hypothetical protein
MTTTTTTTTNPHNTVITYDMLLKHAEKITGVPAKRYKRYAYWEILKMLGEYHGVHKNRLKANIDDLVYYKRRINMKKAELTKPHNTVITHDMLLKHAEKVTGVPAKYHKGYTCQEILKILEQYQQSIVTENERIRHQINVLVVKFEEGLQEEIPF